MIDIKSPEIQELISFAFITLLLQAIVFGLLGILMIVFPRLLDVWLVANFVWMGTSTMLLAWKVRQLRIIKSHQKNKATKFFIRPSAIF